MSFLLKYDGLDLENHDTNNDLMGYYSSNYESDAEDCYLEPSKTETTMNQRTTTTKLKKDGRASLSSFEAPLSAPYRPSRASTISTTSLSSAPSPLPVTSCFSSSNDGQGRKKKKTKLSVQFSHADEHYDILPLKHYTKKERKNCWYTKADLIKRDACFDLLALRIEKNKPPKEDDTYRGLEDLMVEHREKSEKRRVKIVQAVLKAQAKHDSEDERVDFGVVDPIFLALPSMELSQDSKTDALEVGMADMLEVLPFQFEPKKPRRSLPAGQKLGTIIDPFPVPDRPRRYSAPAASALPPTSSSKYDSKEMKEALALFDDIDISTPPPVPAMFLTPETGKVKKRRNSATRRHSLDSSSKHNKSKSKSKSRSTSPGKNKSNIVKSIGSPDSIDDIRSPVKKKAKASVSTHVPAPPKDSKSRTRSSSPSSKPRRSRHGKLPFMTRSATGPSSPASHNASPSKKQSRKRLISSPMQSPRCNITKKNSGPATSLLVGSHHMRNNGGSGMIRIHAPTPPRQDPPGMFQRISSIRLDDQYPPSVPRL
mmetsp:Transcript_25373/g.62443  ORF Transcript_25373/g.62443 Transcript_25373/m.62443 type:complete len:540 (-) Transcript_25373:1203-2822(-)